MDFIATHWWLWLLGLLLVVAVAGVLWIANVIGFVSDAKAVRDQAKRILEVPPEQRKQELASLGLQVAYKKVRGRIFRSVLVGIMTVLGGGFGLLLLLALLRRFVF